MTALESHRLVISAADSALPRSQSYQMHVQSSFGYPLLSNDDVTVSFAQPEEELATSDWIMPADNSAQTGNQSCQKSFDSPNMRHLELSHGAVCVRFSQSDGANSMAAERQCRTYIASHTTKEFAVKLEGLLPTPTVEVTFQSTLLEKLPLLKDIHSTTSDSKQAQLDLPCSIWGLVSLLILLEGRVHVERWFTGISDQQDIDPSLPAHTLQASDFMGCTAMCQQLVKWLQAALKLVINSIVEAQQDDDTLATVWNWSKGHYPARVRHLTKVLRQIPSYNDTDVFSGLLVDTSKHTEAANQAIYLPPALFTRWIVCCAPSIDLRGVNLTPAQWCMLSSAIVQTPASAVTSLQLTATSRLHPLADQFEDIRHWGSGDFLGYCPKRGKTAVYKSNQPCTVCGEAHGFGASVRLRGTEQLDLLQLHTQLRNSAMHENVQMLNAVQGMVAHTSCLQTLGLLNISLGPQLLLAFEQLVDSLPDTLTQLYLSVERGFLLHVHEKTRFFRSLAQVRSLKELHIPQWDKLMGSDAVECTEPLQNLPELRIIVGVAGRNSIQWAALPSFLNFVAAKT